jgi:hypothetical protein
VTEALVWLAVLALANAGIGALGSYVMDRAAESVVLDARRRLVSHLVWLRIPAMDRSEPDDLRPGSPPTPPCCARSPPSRWCRPSPTR